MFKDGTMAPGMPHLSLTYAPYRGWARTSLGRRNSCQDDLNLACKVLMASGMLGVFTRFGPMSYELWTRRIIASYPINAHAQS
jgi:hypothetical protein